VNRAIAGQGVQLPLWEVRSLISSIIFCKGESMSDIVTIGIDLATNVFAAHGVEAGGKPNPPAGCPTCRKLTLCNKETLDLSPSRPLAWAA
jgi:hypothetical protein